MANKTLTVKVWSTDRTTPHQKDVSTFEEIREIVGGHVEAFGAYFNDGEIHTLLVNEDGGLQQLPYNTNIGRVCQVNTGQPLFLRGNVVEIDNIESIDELPYE